MRQVIARTLLVFVIVISDLRQLHAHEHSGHEEAEEDADKTDEEQQEAVEFGNVGSVGAVQDYKAQASHREEETGSQSFHDVLPIYSEKTRRTISPA